jgi:hypothetical protein
MKFDRATAPPIAGPGEQTQAQFDGRRIQGIDGGLQVHPEVFARIQFPGPAHQRLG